MEAYATFIGEKEKMIGLRMQYANQDNIVLIPLSSRSTLKMSSLDIKKKDDFLCDDPIQIIILDLFSSCQQVGNKVYS